MRQGTSPYSGIFLLLPRCPPSCTQLNVANRFPPNFPLLSGVPASHLSSSLQVYFLSQVEFYRFPGEET